MQTPKNPVPLHLNTPSVVCSWGGDILAGRKIIKSNDFLIFVADVLMIFFILLHSNLFQNLGEVLNFGTLDVPMGMEQKPCGGLGELHAPE